ncbi:MAG: GDP-L-fucose synthase [Proteobacteria bacterium]|nr:GDP-L-fucose synthase [Pseudomonadota bacterium]
MGSAVCRTLAQQGYNNIIVAGRDELDLTNQQAVFDFFAVHKPQAQVICAAVVGGIIANDTFPADFIGQNLMIQTNLLEAARRFDCAKTVFMASGCIYPRLSEQPIREEQLLTGALEPTNQWYAVAKLAGIKMGQAYRRQYGLDMVSVLPANLYGTGDSFDLENSHVIPGLMRRFHIAKMEQAKQVTVWGSGHAMREFMHVDDLAAATVFLMQQAQVEEIINIGYGEDMTIAELAQLMKTTVGFSGELFFDTSRPDGTPRKLLDSSHLFSLGWRPTIPLTQGLAATYHWFVENVETLREVNPQAWQK